MSMIGEYLRLSPDELAHALEDPAWALEFAEDALDTEDTEDAEEEAKHFSTDKTWDLLRYLLRRREFPVDVVFGEQPLTEEDWGYGPPGYLDVERVREAAAALSDLSYDVLVGGVDPRAVEAAEVYPLGWTEEADLDWARGYFERLTGFFAAAAAAGDAVALWLD